MKAVRYMFVINRMSKYIRNCKAKMRNGLSPFYFAEIISLVNIVNENYPVITF